MTHVDGEASLHPSFLRADQFSGRTTLNSLLVRCGSMRSTSPSVGGAPVLATNLVFGIRFRAPALRIHVRRVTVHSMASAHITLQQ